MNQQTGRNILIFDTTLRDGEQSPGVSLNTAEKVEIARQLAALKVDVIEAGYPATSTGDFEAVQAIARHEDVGQTSLITCGLARTHVGDIDRAWEAVRDAARPRIHTYISTSDTHIIHMLETTREDVVGQTRAAVAHAKRYLDDVEFSPQDATRTEVEFLAEVVQVAIDEGATTINIPDTVGYAMPWQFTEHLNRLYELVPDLRKVMLSIHCHDDLGMSVVNSVFGVLAGAGQVHGTINGIGERAGNMPLEEFVMAVDTRQDAMSVRTGVNTQEISRTSRLVSRLTGYPIAPNKAVVGRNAFSHESGQHVAGLMRLAETYEIMDPTTIGLRSNSIVLGKHSGRHAVQAALEELGLTVNGHKLNTVFMRFKEVADRKKSVTAMDLEALVSDELRDEIPGYELDWFELEASSRRSPCARVSVFLPLGSKVEGEFSGDGSVDSVFQAINIATSTSPELRDFTIGAVTSGQDALGEVSVVLELDGQTGAGQGIATDIIEAAARAYLRALSVCVMRRNAKEAEAVAASA